MPLPLRKFLLLLHVTASVGWLGAVLAYLALAIVALRTLDAALAQGAYLSMELTGWRVIVPLALAALATGIVQALATEWGLIRHYWVFAKLVVTLVATAVLLAHLPAVSEMAVAARAATLPDAGSLPRMQLVVHAAGGLAVLVLVTTLSIYKPRGLTPFAR